MTFEEWCRSIQLDPNSWLGKANRQVWEAAQFALNNELGVAANEAAKAERRRVAIIKAKAMAHLQDDSDEDWEEIIREAQG